MQKKKIFRNLSCLFLALVLLVGLFTGCDQQEDIYNEAVLSSSTDESESDIASGEGLGGKLTISTYHLYEGIGVQAAAQEFMRAHPDVEIIFDEGLTEADMADTTAEPYDDYVKRLSTEVMSGEGPDIVADIGLLQPEKFGKSGLLEDLYQYMDADEDFDRADYYMNVIDAYAFEGKLYKMPQVFTPIMAYFRKDLLTEINSPIVNSTSTNYKEIIDAFSKLKALPEHEDLKLLVPQMLTPQRSFETFETSGMNNNYDSENFIEYLDITGKLKDTDFPSQEEINYDYEDSLFETNKNVLMSRTEPITLSGLSNYEKNENSELTTVPIYLNSSAGKHVFLYTVEYCITSSCEDKALAWEFIKFTISEAETLAYMDQYVPSDDAKDVARNDLPVNRNNLYAYANLYEKVRLAQQASGKDYLIEQNGEYEFDFAKIAAMDDPYDKEFFDKLDSVIEQLDTPSGQDTALSMTLEDILDKYYTTGTVTAEQCAAELQERADIYLAE